MAQNKATLEKVMQSALKHNAYGSRVAETVASIEAIAAVLQADLDSKAASPFAIEYSVDSQDADSVRRMRVGVAHATYGKRLQDASETLDAMIAALTYVLTSSEISADGQHSQSMEKTCQSSMANKVIGSRLSDMASLQDQMLDQLITDNVANTLTATALKAIRDA